MSAYGWRSVRHTSIVLVLSNGVAMVSELEANGTLRYGFAMFKATRHEQESRPLIRLNGVRADSPTPGNRRTLPSCDDVAVRVRVGRV